jgi:hypothetical protein
MESYHRKDKKNIKIYKDNYCFFHNFNKKDIKFLVQKLLDPRRCHDYQNSPLNNGKLTIYIYKFKNLYKKFFF